MNSVVPSLSTQGWLVTVGEKADRLMSYFFSSEYSQSVCYFERIKSLQYLIAKYKSRPKELEAAIDTAASELLASFFEKIQTDVRVEPDDVSETKYTIYFSCKIIEGTEKYELAHVLKIENSIIAKVAKIANG